MSSATLAAGETITPADPFDSPSEEVIAQGRIVLCGRDEIDLAEGGGVKLAGAGFWHLRQRRRLRVARRQYWRAAGLQYPQITSSTIVGTVGLEWQFSGIGNFSSVLGQSDLLLRNISTGALQVYNIINNNQLTGSASLNAVGSDWQFRGRRPGQRSRNERRPAAVIAISPRWRTARRKVSPASVGNRPSEPRT
jgi:hypothetical protein